MSIGIYCITNLVNGFKYIGQSLNIEKRYKDHIFTSNSKKSLSYNYPLYKDIRKYGKHNFELSILEQCQLKDLLMRESYWINKLEPEYNQTHGIDKQGSNNKLTLDQVYEIQEILIKDTEGVISNKTIAKEYGVSFSTIQSINSGLEWHNSKLKYPLRYRKNDFRNPKYIKKQKYCEDCGKLMYKNAIGMYCVHCLGKHRRTVLPLSREQLKELIRNVPFTKNWGNI